jgi:ammonium transporter, Amt family
MLTSTALVLFMMPGLALFYGGLVGAKNVIATMVQSFVAIGLISAPGPGDDPDQIVIQATG